MEENKEIMENEEILEAPEQACYNPRPVWQRVAAWIGFGIVVVGIILFYYHIANGGM